MSISGVMRAQDTAYAIRQVRDFERAFREQQVSILHERFDPALQQGMPKDRLDILTRQLWDFIGGLDTIRFLHEEQGHYVFQVKGKSRSLFQVVRFDEQGHWSQLLMSDVDPYPEIQPRSKVSTDNPKRNRLDLQVDSVVQLAISQSNTPGFSIGVYQKGRIQYYNYGQRSVLDSARPDETTLYDIGSVSKPFTALLIALAQSRGVLDIQRPVSEYLPDSVRVPAFGGREITLAHLLSHTSRLPVFAPLQASRPSDDPSNPEKFVSRQELLAYLSQSSISDTPGRGWSYSNLAVALAGIVLERQMKASWQDLIERDILKPLGMERTGFGAQENNQTQGHTRDLSVISPIDLDAYAPAGEIKSCTRDLLRFLGLFMGQGGSAELRQAAKFTQNTLYAGSPHMGWSWFIEQNGQGEVSWQHGGSNRGYVSHVQMDPVSGIAVAVLANGYGPEADFIGRSLFQFLQNQAAD